MRISFYAMFAVVILYFGLHVLLYAVRTYIPERTITIVRAAEVCQEQRSWEVKEKPKQL